jgi:short-subunit dehydrogenase
VELLLHGRDTVALTETRKVVEPQCAKVTPLIHDLATARGVSDLIAEVGREPIELLVNNAGIAVVKPFTEITSIEWEQTIGVNVTAPFLLTAALCASNAAGVKHCEHSLCGSEDRVPELERLLHEQVCARRFFTLRTR